MVLATRYLSDAEKATVLVDLYNNLEGLDEGMLPYLERINAMRGLVTLQSCAGHKGVSTFEGEQYDCIESGHLWLRMDVTRHAHFYAMISCLACSPLIERVSLLFLPKKPGQPEGVENVAEIIFRGRGTGQFEEAMEWIINFLETL